MKPMIIFFTFAITSLIQLSAKEEVLDEVPIEMLENVTLEKNTKLDKNINAIIEEEGGDIDQKESTRISNEEELAISEAESIKIKSIARALAIKEEAISKAKKANSLAEIDANKIKAIAKAKAVASAEKKKTESKLRLAQEETIARANESTQKVLSIFKLEAEETKKKLSSVIGVSKANQVIKTTESVSPNRNAGHILKTDRIGFEKGTNILTAQGNNAVQNLAKTLKSKPNIYIEIAGYTDSDGSAVYNKKLSQSRVDMVKKVLMRRHVSDKRLRAHGYGEVNPIAPNTTKSNKEKNRRVEIYVVKQ